MNDVQRKRPRIVTTIQEFLKLESSSGILLMAAAALALLASNVLIPETYAWLGDSTNGRWGVNFGDSDEILAFFNFEFYTTYWINDALMVLFFFLVGLEIKREVMEGELSTMRQASLPLIAALGGVAAPALIFAAMNSGTEAIRGWAIPAATDIAFALGVMSLLGNRVPASLKIFLLAIAIIDDLAAILIIAIFYSKGISFVALGLTVVGLAILAIMNLRGEKRLWPYIIVGLFVWWFVLKSGVHATLAGVMIAMAIPLKGDLGRSSPLHKAEHALHPYVAFLILPIFAFANAGVSFADMQLSDAAGPLPLGILLGLFVGKQIGVFGAAYVAVKAGVAEKPAGANWMQIYAVAILCGIGFTMSLFISGLAFYGDDLKALSNASTLGILMGSTLSAIVGYLLLRGSLSAAEKRTATA